MKLHVFEDNAMNYIALELPLGTTSEYWVFDHDISEEEIEEYVSEYKNGTLLEINNVLTVFTESEFDSIVKLNHRVW